MGFSNDYSDNFQVKDFKASIRWVQKLKPIKSRFTVMLPAGYKFKPIVLGKSKKPRCFRNIKRENLPCYYYKSDSAWITQDIFYDWFLNGFQHELNELFGPEQQVYVVLDNCRALPPQPMDMGIITPELFKSVMKMSQITFYVTDKCRYNQLIINYMNITKTINVSKSTNAHALTKSLTKEVDSDSDSSVAPDKLTCDHSSDNIVSND